MKAEDVRNRHLRWNGNKLCFDKHVVVKLAPNEKYPFMYHLEFKWRNFEKTPEFFNLTNAKENARIYALHRLNSKVPESLTEALGLI